MEQTAEQKLEQLQRIKNQNKARAKKYYEAHKEVIAQRRKAKRDEVRAIVEAAEPTEKLTPAQERKAAALQEVVKVLEEKKSDPTMKNDIKQLARILGTSNFASAFKKPQLVIKRIEEATQKNDPTKKYSTNSKKSMYQSILKLIDNTPIELPEHLKQHFKTKFDVYKVKSTFQTDERNATTEPMKLDKYLKQVKDTFGEVSKEYLVVALYELSGFRDNLQLEIMNKPPKDTSKNYAVVPIDTNKNITILLNKFKTDKTYKEDKIEVNKALSDSIRAYIHQKNLGQGDYLFGKSLLSGFIGKFNKKLGLHITINTLRQMRTKKADLKNMTAEQRVEYAYQMKHSPAMSKNYDPKIQETPPPKKTRGRPKKS